MVQSAWLDIVFNQPCNLDCNRSAQVRSMNQKHQLIASDVGVTHSYLEWNRQTIKQSGLDKDTILMAKLAKAEASMKELLNYLEQDKKSK